MSVGASSTCLEQFAPLYAARVQIRERHRIGLRTIQLDAGVVRLPRWLDDADAVLLQCNHFMDRAVGERVIEWVRQAAFNCPLLYLDDAGVAWPAAIRHCDLYVKNQLYRDRNWYLRRFIGKSNLTDYVASHHENSIEADHFPASEPLAEADLRKLELGWNLGCSARVARFATAAVPSTDRTIDVVFRGNVPEGWLKLLCTILADPLEAIMRRWNAAIDAKRRPWPEYVKELCSARACVSPFGYGKICFLDFEAVLAGAVLIKPDISHLETRPDIYQPWRPYAPVKWDWSDLPEVVERVLAAPGTGESLAVAALGVLKTMMCPATIADVFRGLLRRSGVDAVRRTGSEGMKSFAKSLVEYTHPRNGTRLRRHEP